MKVMTFNIQHCLDYKKNRINIPLFIDTIKYYNVDICGLNEVRGKGSLFGYTNQTDSLGDGLAFNRYFAKAIMVKGKGPYGNALVTRFPLKSTETIKIPDPDDKNKAGCFETRCVLKSVVDVNGKAVCGLVCHMGLEESERINAVETLCKIIDTIDTPIVLMGDFNTISNDAVLKPLYDRLSDTDASAEKKGMFTYPSYNPEKKIDYIFYRGLTCNSVKNINEVVSDHFPIVADFAVE